MSSVSKSDSKRPVSQDVSQKITLTPLPVSQRLVPFSKIATQNSFSPLTPTKSNSSFSKIVQQNPAEKPKTLSPFSKSNAPSSSSKYSKPSTSQYISNPNIQKIQILEDYQLVLLSKGFHVLLDHLYGSKRTFNQESYKSREYYQAILENTGSVKITHKTNHGSPLGSIDYSKAQIFKIITPEEWGTNLCSQQFLKEASTAFNYYDYQDAWYRSFLVKNYSHSWFVFFDKQIDGQYPKWFVNWYRLMGLLPNCLPEIISEGFSKFKKIFIQEISDFEYMLQFTMIFKIPWIFTWSYQYQEASGDLPPWLNRRYQIKWWDKFDISQANDKAVVKHYHQLTRQSRPSQELSKPEDLVKIEDKTEDSDLVARIISAAKSSPRDVSLLLEDIRRSPSPSTSSKTDLFQDAQDPYEDPYED